MNVQEQWIADHIIQVTMKGAVNSSDMKNTFANVDLMISSKQRLSHCIFDVSAADRMPTVAPLYALQSGLFQDPYLGITCVVGTNELSRKLAEMAAMLTKKEMLFFNTLEEAQAHLAVISHD